jgi:predicted nucleotidyltransferase
MMLMDRTLQKFRDDAINALGNNLVCLFHHGSRAKCEAHVESDYDSIIVVSKVDAKTIKTVQTLLQSNPGFTTYLLSLYDIESLPKGHLLEFLCAKELYGKPRLEGADF